MVDIAVSFKEEDEWEGEPVGPLYIYDEDEPERWWTGHLDEKHGSPHGAPGTWLKLSEARAWAMERGYKFYPG